MESNWEKRNITDINRVNDAVEMYQALGFDVKVEDYNIAMCDVDCNECMKETPERFKVIYTRPGSNTDDGLFDD